MQFPVHRFTVHLQFSPSPSPIGLLNSSQHQPVHVARSQAILVWSSPDTVRPFRLGVRPFEDAGGLGPLESRPRVPIPSSGFPCWFACLLACLLASSPNARDGTEGPSDDGPFRAFRAFRASHLKGDSFPCRSLSASMPWAQLLSTEPGFLLHTAFLIDERNESKRPGFLP